MIVCMQTGYSQFCPIEGVRDFATLRMPLLMRELMVGMHSFNDIQKGRQP